MGDHIIAAMQAKAKQKAGPKQAAQEGGDAWAAAPDKLLRLRVKDVRNTLKERWLQLFWPEDGRWWPGQVLDIRCKERKIHLMYKTGAFSCPYGLMVRLCSLNLLLKRTDFSLRIRQNSWLLASTLHWKLSFVTSLVRQLPLHLLSKLSALPVPC